jgi:Cu-processing system permease protein
MKAILRMAMQEVRASIRNRLVLATTLVLAALAVSIVFLGSAPVGVVDADPVSLTVVSLASLTIFLVPLLALMLSFDTVVGEAERGTLLLLLSYPVTRWQIVAGKFLGQSVILVIATLLGFGAAGLLLLLQHGSDAGDWPAFIRLIASSILLGAVFIAIGGLVSVTVRERATAAGAAVGIWLVFVLLYDGALLALLVADQGRFIGTATLDALLLLNPTDAYRLYNLAGDPRIAMLSGLTGTATAEGGSNAQQLLALLAWVVAPLALTVRVFSRRQP